MKMNRLIPMLPVKSMPASVDFYRQMLGFEVEARNDDWGWAMLRFDECRLMVDQSINAHPGEPRDSIVYLYPDDVVAYHRQVRENGLAVPELAVTFYGLCCEERGSTDAGERATKPGDRMSDKKAKRRNTSWLGIPNTCKPRKPPFVS
jgi:catechol 2,3-dioxygenase-like lactoylglutathione lyase family enzyme